MDFIYITNDITRAKIAQTASVDRIMVDMEIHGKLERQGHLNTVISRHTLDDVRSVRAVLMKSALVVRINGIFSHSREEINNCIDLGADILMLPMFTTVGEVERFVSMVYGRAKTCLLLETGQALARAHDILDVPGIDEVHIGLNDLHLQLKLKSMFELLSGGLIDYLAQALRDRGIKFGFGGVARLNRGEVKSNLILSEHVRLGSSQVILSRDFGEIFENRNEREASELFCREIHLLREFLSTGVPTVPIGSETNTKRLKEAVRGIVERHGH